MLTYDFLQEYSWFVISFISSFFAFFIFVNAGGGLLFLLGRNEMQRSLIIKALDRKWIFVFFSIFVFALFAFICFPGFQQEDVGNGFLFWFLFTLPFILYAIASECIHYKPSSTLLRTTCQWIMVVCGWVIPYVMGFVNCAFYTGTGNVSLLNIVNGFFGLSYVQTGALFYLYMVIRDEDVERRIIRLLAVTSSLFIFFSICVVLLIFSFDGLECDAEGVFYSVPLKYMTNFIELPHSLACAILGICLILSSIVITLLFSIRWSFRLFSVGSVCLLSSFIQIAGFNRTPVFPCYSDPQRSLSLANSCASESVLFAMFIVSLFLPVLGWFLYKFWHRLEHEKWWFDMRHKKHFVFHCQSKKMS